jgi:hypothetical protein
VVVVVLAKMVVVTLQELVAQVAEEMVLQKILMLLMELLIEAAVAEVEVDKAQEIHQEALTVAQGLLFLDT